MTRPMSPGGNQPATPKSVSVHGCVQLGGTPAPLPMAPQMMREVVAAGAAARVAAQPSSDLGDTPMMPFALAPAAPHLQVVPPAPPPRAPAMAEPAPVEPFRPLATAPLPLRVPVAPVRQPAPQAVRRQAPVVVVAPPRAPVVMAPIAAVAPAASPAPAILAVPAALPALAALPASVAAAAPVAAPARVAVPAPVAEPAAQSPAPAPAADPAKLFRREALDAVYGLSGSEDDAKLPKPSTYGWAILALIGSLALFIFGGAALAKIEVTVVAQGALRAPQGLRAIAATLPGSVAEVLVRAGDDVEAGQILARLDVAQLEATLTLREQELETLQRESAVAERADVEYAKQMERALLQRRGVLHKRSSINHALKSQRKDQLDRMSESVRQGVATVNQELGTRELLQDALESEQLLRAGIADIDMQLAETATRLEDRALSRRTELARAVAAVTEARSLIERADIRSPAAGRLESLLVSPGSVVEAGQQLAQVVPNGALRSIVAFLPSRETTFVQAGTLARVEVESLPVSEFGQAQAKVTRVSTDIAKPQEMVNQFGEAAPGSFVRVELELAPETEQAKMAPHLRSGERVLVRLHRRERRIISLMFEFVRTWLEQ
jgi:multidrug resistance efflux pump